MKELTEREELCFRCELPECVGNRKSTCLIYRPKVNRKKIQTVLFSDPEMIPKKQINISALLDLARIGKKVRYPKKMRRVVKIIEWLGLSGDWEARQMAEYCGIPRSSRSRWIRALEKKQWIEKTKEGRFLLGSGEIFANRWRSLICDIE